MRVVDILNDPSTDKDLRRRLIDLFRAVLANSAMCSLEKAADLSEAMNLQRAFLSDPERCTPEVLRNIIEDWRHFEGAAGSDEEILNDLASFLPITWFARESLKHPTIKKFVEDQSHKEIIGSAQEGVERSNIDESRESDKSS